MPTYRIDAKSYLPDEEITYTRTTTDYHLARKMARILCCAFDEVTVSDNDTGTLYLSHYVGMDFEKKTLTCAEALIEIQHLGSEDECLGV